MSTKTSMMKLKVSYTFDSDQNFLSRSSANFKIKYGELDISDSETRLIGVVKLRSCIQTVLKSSPELLSELQTKYDYNVYIWDYSEYNSPLVSYGLLSNLLNTGYSPNSTINIINNSSSGKVKEILIPGKVEQNASVVVSSSNSNTPKYSLNIKLKFRQIILEPSNSAAPSIKTALSSPTETNHKSKQNKQSSMMKKPAASSLRRSINHNPAPRATRTYSMPVTFLNHGTMGPFNNGGNINIYETITSSHKGITYHMTDDTLKINRKLSSATVTTADDNEFLRLAAAKASKKQSKKKSSNESMKANKSKITINRKLPTVSNMSPLNKPMADGNTSSKNYWVIKNNNKKSLSSPMTNSGKINKKRNPNSTAIKKSIENLSSSDNNNKENIPPLSPHHQNQSIAFSIFASSYDSNSSHNNSNNHMNIDSDLGSDATAVFQASSSPPPAQSNYANNSTSSPMTTSSSPGQISSSPMLHDHHNIVDLGLSAQCGREYTASFSPTSQLISMEMPTSDTSISEDTSVRINYSEKKEIAENKSITDTHCKFKIGSASASCGISNTELEELLSFNQGSFLDALYPSRSSKVQTSHDDISIITPEDPIVLSASNSNNTHISSSEDKTPRDLGDALTPILESTEENNNSKEKKSMVHVANNESINSESNQENNNLRILPSYNTSTAKNGPIMESSDLKKSVSLASSPFAVYD